MRIAIVLPNWIGDVVMATPAIRALRKLAGPDGQLIGLMRPYVAEVLAGTSWLDSQILYVKPKSKIRIAAPDVYQGLREARLDRVVLLTNSLRTAWIAWWSGARERIGYKGQGRSWMLTNRMAMPRIGADGKQISTIESYLRLAEAAGCEAESPRLELATTLADERAADEVWQWLRLPPGHEVVVFNTGGAYGAAKIWPAEHFAELAKQIVNRRGDKLWVLVNCGPAEREIARDIVARSGSPRVVSLADCDQLPIGLTKACVRRSRMVVSTDSGPRFMGIAFDKPVVTLFGPTDPVATATHYEAETSLSLSLDCQPCMERVCPLVHHRCMRDLTVERVYAAVARGLDTNVGEDAA
jgi:heptosyltransferase-2